MPDIALGGVSALNAPPGVTPPRPRKSGPARPKRKAGPRLRKFRNHAALIVGSASFSAIMIGIVLNATVMQKEHHPAPLFGTPAAPARAVAPVEPKSLPSQPPAPLALVPPPAVDSAPLPAAAAPAVPTRARPTPTPALRPKAADAVVHGRVPKSSDAITRFLAPSRPAARPSGVVAAKPAPVAAVESRPLPPATAAR